MTNTLLEIGNTVLKPVHFEREGELRWQSQKDNDIPTVERTKKCFHFAYEWIVLGVWDWREVLG